MAAVVDSVNRRVDCYRLFGASACIVYESCLRDAQVRLSLSRTYTCFSGHSTASLSVADVDCD